jgi:DNA-binding CsgD family transcriptional regulator
MLSLSEKLRSTFEGLAAIALVTDPQAAAPNLEATLRILFNLTGAEARLAAHIVAGTSLREAAENLAIEESTARQYVKQVMAKSETHRQSEFVALANRLLHPVIRRDR